MTRLVRPDVRLHESWAEAVREFGEGPMDGSGSWELERLEPDESGCRALVETLLPLADPATQLPEGRVHCTYLWITDGDPETFVGHLALRHTLTPWMLDEIGHIGYSVRPSRRRQGYAAAALRLGVGEAARLGLARVLLTCDEGNLGSRRTIESCGGVYEDSRNGKRRYWIVTGADQP